jgi:hypothetical protein
LLRRVAGIKRGQIAHVLDGQVGNHPGHDCIGACARFVFRELFKQVVRMLSSQIRVCAQRAIAIHAMARHADLASNSFAFGGVAEIPAACFALAVPRSTCCNG